MPGLTGRYVNTAAPRELGGQSIRAFVPHALPPKIDLSHPDLLRRLTEANRALGRLDGIRDMVPNPDLFLYFFIRKEALLSSQIEGTQSSLSDLLLIEADAAPNVAYDDVAEVTNYVTAMNYGLERLQDIPLSTRLIREMHGLLMQGVRGRNKNPGEFRTTQNWIGGLLPGVASFVPPPPQHVVPLMSDLEKFIHANTLSEAPLIKAAFVHVQFETIHPFLDGNGRLGRLLITLMLCDSRTLHAPLLYLSLYLKERRQDYYELLSRIRSEGAWHDWLVFFLDGVIDTSKQAHQTARNLLSQFASDAAALRGMGRAGDSALRVLEAMQKRPICTVKTVMEQLAQDQAEISAPTVRAAMGRLTELGIVRQPPGRQRDRIYIYDAMLDILSQGTDPL